MTLETLTNPKGFDQHDIEIEAGRLINNVIKKAGDDLNFLIALGRRLCFSRSSITKEQRVLLYTIMMHLRHDGILILPARLMNDFVGRVLTYEAICRQLYAELSK